MLPSPAMPEIDAAFLAALERERAQLRAFLAGLCRGDVHFAEDLVQESLTRAWRYRASFDGRAALGPWLRQIAFRVYLDGRGRRAQHVELVEEPAGREVPLAQLRDELEWALAGLSERERDVVLRFHGHGESVAEIAAALGRPEGTIKSDLHRARRKMAGRQT